MSARRTLRRLLPLLLLALLGALVAGRRRARPAPEAQPEPLMLPAVQAGVVTAETRVDAPQETVTEEISIAELLAAAAEPDALVAGAEEPLSASLDAGAEEPLSASFDAGAEEPLSASLDAGAEEPLSGSFAPSIGVPGRVDAELVAAEAVPDEQIAVVATSPEGSRAHMITVVDDLLEHRS